MNKRRKAKNGSSLIEALIYLTCCVWLASITAIFIIHFTGSLQKELTYSTLWIDFYTAHDRIMQTLSSFSCEPFCWKSFSTDLLIYNDDIGETGWFLKDKTLYYKKAAYHFVLLEQVESLQFEYIFAVNKKNIRAITCSLIKKINGSKAVLKRTVELRS